MTGKGVVIASLPRMKGKKMNKHEYKIKEEADHYHTLVDVFAAPKEEIILKARLDMRQGEIRKDERGHEDIVYLGAKRFLEDMGVNL